jgi:hypothetical protein
MFLKMVGNGIFWTLCGIAVCHSTLKRKLRRLTRNIVKNTLEDDVTFEVPKLRKNYKGLIQPGDYIKHAKFMDICVLVTGIGMLEHGATSVQILGLWYNQGCEKSWCIGHDAQFTINVDNLHEWSLCVNPEADKCLRKCDWTPLAFQEET